MKTKIIFLNLLFVIFISSCIVKSLHPFFKEKDVVFKKELLGTWHDQDAGKWVIKQRIIKSEIGLENDNSTGILLNNYTVSFTDKDGESKFTTHLFTLNNQLYADFIPDSVNTPSLTAYHLVTAHSVAKVYLMGDSIKLKWFNEIWLADLFKNNKIRISHETISDKDKVDSYILTASTDELQKFLIKYGDDPKAFTEKSDSKTKKRKEILCYSLKRVKQ